MLQHPMHSPALLNTWTFHRVKNLGGWGRNRVGTKSYINTFNPSLSLTGLPGKGLARLHPRALWGGGVSRAGTVAPPGTFQHGSSCQASGLRYSLSWDIASPHCTGSPRPSWRMEGRHSQQARGISETALSSSRLPLPPHKACPQLLWLTASERVTSGADGVFLLRIDSLSQQTPQLDLGMLLQSKQWQFSGS